jgi:hypothetical protein
MFGPTRDSLRPFRAPCNCLAFADHVHLAPSLSTHFFAAAAAAAVALAACCALTLACCFSASVTRLERHSRLASPLSRPLQLFGLRRSRSSRAVSLYARADQSLARPTSPIDHWTQHRACKGKVTTTSSTPRNKSRFAPFAPLAIVWPSQITFISRRLSLRTRGPSRQTRVGPNIDKTGGNPSRVRLLLSITGLNTEHAKERLQLRAPCNCLAFADHVHLAPSLSTHARTQSTDA